MIVESWNVQKEFILRLPHLTHPSFFPFFQKKILLNIQHYGHNYCGRQSADIFEMYEDTQIMVWPQQWESVFFVTGILNNLFLFHSRDAFL